VFRANKYDIKYYIKNNIYLLKEDGVLCRLVGGGGGR
jgi:hypothetical protein